MKGPQEKGSNGSPSRRKTTCWGEDTVWSKRFFWLDPASPPMHRSSVQILPVSGATLGTGRAMGTQQSGVHPEGAKEGWNEEIITHVSVRPCPKPSA